MRDLKISASMSSSKYKSGKSLTNMKKKSENVSKNDEVDKVKADEKKVELKKDQKLLRKKRHDSDHESEEEFDEQPVTLTENTDSYASDDEDELRKFDEDSGSRKGRGDSLDRTPDFEGLFNVY